MVRSVGSGLVTSLLSLAYAFSYGALIFAGPLQPYLAYGVAAALITTAITAPIVALTSSFRCAIAGPDSNTSALLAVMLSILATTLPTLPAEQALTLALTGLFGATLITGLSLFLLGWRRLGKLVRYVPYPVIAGFLAATGWLMLTGAIRMTTGIELSWTSLPSFLQAQTVLPLGLTMLWAAALWMLTAWTKNALVLPLALVAATIATHVVLVAAGLPANNETASSLMFSIPGGYASFPVASGSFVFADWSALAPVAGDMLAIAVLGILSILLNSTSIELATGADADLDRELRMQGVANIASAFAGGFVGHVSVSRTLVNIAAGGLTRLSGVIVGLVALAVLIGDARIVEQVPRFVLGGLVLQLGAKLIWDWGVLSRRSLPSRDWMVVVAIVLITANFGFLQALLFGLLAGCVIFVVDVSLIQVIRHQFGLDERSSSLVRAREESNFLSEHGGQVQVLELTNYLFFGSAYSLLERVSAIVSERHPKEIIFDFSAVTGIDSSAGASFARIRELLRKNDIRQVMSAMSPAAVRVLSSGSGFDDEIHRFGHLDSALEDAEEALLSAHDTARGTRRSMVDWLQDVVGSRECAEELFGCLTPSPRSADSYLCRQGDPTDSLIFVECGPISVILERQDQSPLRVRVFGAHTLVGEVGFFLHTPRSASLVAGPDAIAWALSHSAFEQFMKRHPKQTFDLAIYVIRLQSERLTFANRQIASLER